MHKCRVCGDSGIDLLEYAHRRWCHFDCGVARWGNSFLERVGTCDLGDALPNRDPSTPFERALAALPRRRSVVNR